MGCGGSKGEAGKNEENIKFDKVGVASIDNFFDQAMSCKESLDNVIAPMEEVREKMCELTGFEWIPGTSKSQNALTDFRAEPHRARHVPRIRRGCPGQHQLARTKVEVRASFHYPGRQRDI